MNVGLCWQGSRSHRNDAVRSIPLADLIPLLDRFPAITWHCLAKDEWRPEMAEHGWRNPLAACHDWLDSAKAIGDLDLIISVDTALVHLAGGLGTPPVWMLLAAMPDMRWMLGREDTPWYANVTLYRQQKVGEWGPVLERVGDDLQRLVDSRERRAA